MRDNSDSTSLPQCRIESGASFCRTSVVPLSLISNLHLLRFKFIFVCFLMQTVMQARLKQLKMPWTPVFPSLIQRLRELCRILYTECHIEYYVIPCKLCRILYGEFHTEYYVIPYELCRILYIECHTEYYVMSCELCRILYIECYVKYYVRLQFCDRVSLSWPGRTRIYKFLPKPCEYLELHACTNRYSSGDS